MRRLRKWTQEEIEYLKENYPKLKIRQINIHLFYRTSKSIRRKIQNLGLKFGIKLWNKREINYLKNNYGKISTLIISEKLERSLTSVYYKAEKLGLRSETKTYFKPRLDSYSEQEDEILKKYWGEFQAREIKQKFSIIFEKRTVKGIRHRAERLNLKSGFVSNKGKLNGMFGKNHKKDSKLKMSSKLIKKWNNKSYKNKMSIAFKNRIYTPEGKRKIKQKMIKLWKNLEYRYKITKAIRIGLHQRPSLPEKQVIQIIKFNKLPFNYTGDGKVFFNGFNPDFLSKNSKYIIEVYGEYYHNLPENKERDKRRIKLYNFLGYQLLVIWQHELENPQRVTEKIVEFM